VDGRGEAKPLPKPLTFGRSAALVETQDVFIFGYPLGESLGLNISVNKSTVSSLRKDRTGAIEIVQVAGGMHPGNSGGPVADKNGAIIGVSVAGIVGTSINFAIPAEITARFVREQIASGGNLKGGRFPTAPPRRRR
jgi:S1-C subfamily serine protease